MSTKKTNECTKKCCEKTSDKCDKNKCNKSCMAKKPLNREDRRQAVRVTNLAVKADFISRELKNVFKEISSEKFKKLPAIDRHITLLLFNSLETYLTALNLKKHWESVRTVTSAGVKLNKNLCNFWDFVFGRAMFRNRSSKKSAK